MKTRALRFSDASHKELAENGRHRFAAQHALCLYAANAIYSFIPKNACSTLRYSLALANGCIADDKDLGWIHRNNATFRASLRDLATADYTFVVLRCPFARLASFFLDKLADVHPAAETHAGRAYLEMSSRSIEDVSFETFVRDLDDRDLLSRNGHWRPQSDFLVYRDYDDYFCVEDFGAAERVLREKTGFAVRDTRHLLDPDGAACEKIGRPGEYAKTPAPDLAALKRAGKIPDIRALYSDEASARARRIYATDCALFRERCGRAPMFDR